MFPFIALEGCDGVGKTTIRNLIRDELIARAFQCKTIGQHSWLNPAYARLIVRLRDHKYHPSKGEISNAYAADKWAHGKFNVEPAQQHSVVIADRWFYSDAVYHSVLYGIDMAHTLAMHKSQGTVLPTIVIYVSTPVDEAYRRILKRGRQTRHYEKPGDLRLIAEAYDTLFSTQFESPETVLRFSNTSSNLEDRIRAEILPAIFSLVP